MWRHHGHGAIHTGRMAFNPRAASFHPATIIWICTHIFALAPRLLSSSSYQNQRGIMYFEFYWILHKLILRGLILSHSLQRTLVVLFVLKFCALIQRCRRTNELGVEKAWFPVHVIFFFLQILSLKSNYFGVCADLQYVLLTLGKNSFVGMSQYICGFYTISIANIRNAY